MWIRKTESDLLNKVDNKRRFFIWYIINDNVNPIKFSIIIFAFTFIFELLSDLFIGVPKPRFELGTGGHYPKIQIKDIPNRLHYYISTSLLIALFLGLFLYLLQRAKAKKDKDSIKLDYVCDKCNKLKTDDDKYDCDCGGEFLHINKMKWINDD